MFGVHLYKTNLSILLLASLTSKSTKKKPASLPSQIDFDLSSEDETWKPGIEEDEEEEDLEEE